METNLIRQINKEKQAFEDKCIQIVPNLLFNQKKTIEKIYFYYNSKFKTGEIDTEGDRKYFFNIVKNPCKTTTKAIDFDTKHIDIQTAEGGDPLRTWYFERDLKFWMKDQRFGKILNRIFEELPIFGSVVIKMVDGKPKFVDLRNFVVEQCADSLDLANYIIERHPYTVANFKKTAKIMGWEKSKVKEAIDLFHQMKDVDHIMVYERYGEVEDKHGNWTYRRVCLADVGIDEEDLRNKSNIPYKGVELSSVEVDGHPYWEFHLTKIPGRWLGIGIVETLFEPQVRENEIANLQSKGSYWAALQLFQSRDPQTQRNLLVEAQNGDILTAESEITKIDISDRNLAFFSEETRKWLENRDELTFSYDVVKGERLPAGTPLGSARIAATMAGSHFDQIRENIALDIKEFLYNAIIPTFQKQSSNEHMLRLAGEDLDKVRNMLINNKAINALFRFMEKKNKLPTKDYFETLKAAITERVKQGKEKLLKIPKDFYKDLKYKIDIVITGEQKDTRVWAATLFAALQAMTADPTLLTNPMKRKVFSQWLEAGGVNLADIEPDRTPSTAEQLEQISPQISRAGGGVSRPQMPQAPVPGETQAAL